MHSNICTHTDARTHVLRKRDIRECLSGNFVRLFPLFSALTQVESQASWTRAKFYNFPLKVLSPPFPAPSTPPTLVQHSCRPGKQLTHISVSAYATKWPKVAWWLVTIFFCLFPAALTLNFSPCCHAGSGFYCFQCLFFCFLIADSIYEAKTNRTAAASFLANGRDSSNRRNRRLRVDWKSLSLLPQQQRNFCSQRRESLSPWSSAHCLLHGGRQRFEILIWIFRFSTWSNNWN